MKQLLVLCLIIGLGSLTYSQTVTLLDGDNRQPLEGATIVGTSGTFATTNAKGQTNISSFLNDQKIEIRSLGYKTIKTSYSKIQDKGFVIYLTISGVSLDEVVISASKFEEQQTDVVQRIQVIRKSELQQMNQTSMADVLTGSGNIMVQKSQQGGGSPIIRGFETNKVLLVVDGVRMNNAIYRGGHLQNVITLDNSIMDRVEVVYGAGSVVYGSDALGGVMHFYTKNPTLSNTDKVLVQSNAYSRYNSASSGYALHADVSIGNQRLGSLTSVTYSKFSDLKQGKVRNPFYGNFGSRPWYVNQINGIDSLVINSDSNLQVGSAYTQYDLLQKFIFKQSEKVSHLINIQFSNSGNIPRYDRLTQVKGNNPKYGEWYYGPQMRFYATYTLLLDSPDAFYDHARFIMGYQNIEESRHSRIYKSVDLESQMETVDIININADFDKVLNKNELRYGAEAVFNKVNSTAHTRNINTGTTGPLATRYPDGGSTMNSFAIYGTHTWEISDKVILNDGLRLNYVHLNSKFVDKTYFPFPYDEVTQNNTSINGNIGIVMQPGMGWRITLQGATGFRAPNVDDMSKVFESVPGSVLVPNPDLKPEYTYNGEIGISKTFNKLVITSVTAYYTHLSNAIVTQPSTFDGNDSIMYNGELSKVTTMENAGEAYIYGLEGRVAGNLNEYLSLVGTINYTYGRIKTDTTDYPLDHIAPVFGKVSFNVSKKKFSGEFFVNYSGWKRLEDYNLYGEDNVSNATEYGMPAWMTLNVRLNYQFTNAIGLQVACENILDQNYRVFASNISAPGRNFIITLRGSF